MCLPNFAPTYPPSSSVLSYPTPTGRWVRVRVFWCLTVYVDLSGSAGRPRGEEVRHGKTTLSCRKKQTRARGGGPGSCIESGGADKGSDLL